MRDAVARLQQDYVAGDQFRGVDPLLLPLASNGRFGPEHPGQGADGTLGLGRLEMADDGVDQDNP